MQTAGSGIEEGEQNPEQQGEVTSQVQRGAVPEDIGGRAVVEALSAAVHPQMEDDSALGFGKMVAGHRVGSFRLGRVTRLVLPRFGVDVLSFVPLLR